ncbi:MAG: glycosyltransferase [Nitrososphaerales archaeon]
MRVRKLRSSQLRDYDEIVGTQKINEINTMADRLRDRRTIHVNSAAVGGGVSEILSTMVPLMVDVGVESEWHVIEGDRKFFRITKSIHNALHGDHIELSDEMKQHLLKVNEENASNMQFLNDADFVIIHDPQPASIIFHFPRRKGKWIWRCHIDLSSPNPEAWEFLKKSVSAYDAAVFHTDSFAKKDLTLRQFIVPPSIDPLSPKNRNLEDSQIKEVIQKLGISMKKPIVTQIGRFDRLKDPEGVVTMFKQLRASSDLISSRFLTRMEDRAFMAETKEDPKRKKQLQSQLVLAGGFASDDPEGQEVYDAVLEKAAGNKSIHVLSLPPSSDIEVNALQRVSSVVLQKSLREGFGLTVSEALWKGKPVVGGNAGGIPLQIMDGYNGFLVTTIDEASAAIASLIRYPRKAKEMGKIGKEHVRKNFLITRHIRDYLLMFQTLDLIPQRSTL